jgi:hypothetical protein
MQPNNFTPEQMKVIDEMIDQRISMLFKNKKYLLGYDTEIGNGKNVILGTSVGTKFGTATDQKFSFYGKTPIIQQATINDPAGGLTVDSEARTAINTLIDRLQAYGFIA